MIGLSDLLCNFFFFLTSVYIQISQAGITKVI